MPKQKSYHYLLLFLSLSLYIAIGYGIQRHETLPLFVCYFLLFLFYVWIIIEKKENNFWIMAAILFRAALLFSVPSLSDDFYRFIWDGRLLAAGHHPFAEVPSYYMVHNISIPGIDSELYNKLNSKENFTVYPPLSQFIFWLSVKLSPDSIYGSMFIMRLIIFSCEIGTLWIITKILRHFNQTPSAVLIYALNPLVIIELTGNLHFEGVMMFFLLLAIWFSLHHKKFLSATFYAFSICTKLIPLIFLPLLSGRLGWKKGIHYWFITAGVTALLFVPLLTMDFVSGFSESIGYYFQKFEFNASIYYLIREAGYYLFGFNIIHIAGWALAGISTTLILTLAYYRIRNNTTEDVDTRFFIGMLWCLLIYFTLTTTLHPWYIISLIIISVFTQYRFPIVWSGLIFITYAGYTRETFNENLQIIAVEYIIVTAYLLYETVWSSRLNHS